jgi:hypothetical protein
MIHLVKKILSVEPYTLTLMFNTGEIRKVDLHNSLSEWSKSPSSKFRQLLDGRYFCAVKFDAELETVRWDNDIDFSPEMLYRLSQEAVVEERLNSNAK